MNMFDENKLREEIARVWGQYGAHMEVYDMLLKRAQVKHEPITAEEVLNEPEDMETYNREEVYMVAQRSVRAAINNILSENNSKPISEIINSEIDTVKLF